MIRRLNLVLVSHNIVIYQASTITNASSTAMGIMDSVAARVLARDAPEFNEVKDFYLLIPQANSGVVGFSKVDPALVTPEMLEKRRIARLRGGPLYNLEVIMEKALDRNSSFYDTELDAFLAFSLLRSGKNSGAVREYAETMGIAEEEAYCELLHRVETRGLQRVKNYATYCQHRDAINATEDLNEIQNRVNLVDSI